LFWLCKCFPEGFILHSIAYWTKSQGFFICWVLSHLSWQFYLLSSRVRVTRAVPFGELSHNLVLQGCF
jgi:hypothetical protein